MDPPAAQPDVLLAPEPEHAALRCRRSNSITEDVSVQKTNDDATECKRSAVALGYWSDPFVSLFTTDTIRRDPEIHRGYWARIAAIRLVVERFLKIAGPSAQIVNLGAGFDTLYWHLYNHENLRRFVDVDFSSVTSKKVHHIMRPSAQMLKAPLTRDASRPIRVENRCNLTGANYALIGADLRQLKEFSHQLIESQLAALDTQAPTLFICECVLVYMAVDQSNALLRLLAERFPKRAFVNYEQINLQDKFSDVMQSNLRERGITLAGMHACENENAAVERFTSNGWPHARCITMRHIYDNVLPKSEIKRIESIEFLDERELLSQLLDHYAITFAHSTDTHTGQFSQCAPC